MDITIETDLGEFDLKVNVTHIDPFIPARLHGHPDSWHPESGGEIEYDIVSVIHSENDYLNWKNWKNLDEEERYELQRLTLKATFMKTGSYNDQEYLKIIEAINSELEFEQEELELTSTPA